MQPDKGLAHDSQTLPRTLGELRRSPWGRPPLLGRSVRSEVRANLLSAIGRGEELFPGIQGYEESVVPQLV
ncbi:MAG TPA: hypothetical protein VFN96_07865, partial [Gemmatimonadales bacterium]|nr:hypothetical protein [Gemmatimonadales bacterium]